ncbi:Nop-domain-containing protein [Clavulina sp. PMI_390]|nr:Nop-domain-containing protein [Clavulina sp. PMI_390]
MAAATHVLFESSSGYALFKAKLVEEIGSKEKDAQASIYDLHKFGKMVELKSFVPFKSAAHALENANDVSEGIVNEYLKSMLELNLGSSSKSSKKGVVLAVSDRNLATSIKDSLSISCDTSPRSLDLIRGIRFHAEKLLGGMSGLQAGDMTKAQLGLGHSYSRSKVKFNVNRSDNMIIQAIALLDQLDKDVNTFSMRIREWYGYTFPELAKLVPDNLLFARCAQFIGNKVTLTPEKLEELTELLDGDATTAKNVLDAARTSMGTDLNDLDAINIHNFASRVVGLAEYRKRLVSYLTDKMNVVAPSLTALIGERIGARLISHAGSLTNLSKYPASTVQILGAEKALFRALKTKGNTPKYGLIYHSSFIGRAGAKHKGRISRFLANKCSIASRIDCFSDAPTSKFGDALRNQVEERLNFFETGTAPTKNSETMRKVLESLGIDADEDDDDDSEDEEMAAPAPAPVVVAEPSPKKDKKKDKKDKKRKAEEMDVDADDAAEAERAAKKAAKKAKKAKAAAEEAEAEVNGLIAVSLSCFSEHEKKESGILTFRFHRQPNGSSKKPKKDKSGEDGEREKKKHRKSKTD